MFNNQKMLDFINASPTAFHAVDEIVKILENNGFEKLSEQGKWDVKPNGKYYVTRNHSSIIAFDIPSNVKNCSFRMVASHSDSPTFKIKPNAIIKSDKYTKLNVEGYGGLILNTWMDKPLSIAGRLMVKTKNGIEEKLVCVDEDLCIIPNMSIHQNRGVNEGMKYNQQVDMLPIIGYGEEDVFMNKLAKSANIKKEDICGFDLYLYNRQQGTIWGNEQYVSSGRLDDLQCAYTTLEGFVQADSKAINVYCCFDNEEVGSSTRQGANSTFLEDCLLRVASELGEGDNYHQMIARSFLVSADNAHSVHPNHPELADPTNRVNINGGVVVKYNANQSYTSDSFSAALFVQCCKDANVEVQYFTNRSDARGGGTLGNISTSHVSVASVDVGLAQWAMHSSYETAGCKDTDDMIKAMKSYFEKEFEITENGIHF